MEEMKQMNRKPLEEMNVIDDFLFTEIMSDEENGLEVCRMILNCVLKRKVDASKAESVLCGSYRCSVARLRDRVR